jgi:hypothetical protein
VNRAEDARVTFKLHHFKAVSVLALIRFLGENRKHDEAGEKAAFGG